MAKKTAPKRKTGVKKARGARKSAAAAARRRPAARAKAAKAKTGRKARPAKAARKAATRAVAKAARRIAKPVARKAAAAKVVAKKAVATARKAAATGVKKVVAKRVAAKTVVARSAVATKVAKPAVAPPPARQRKMPSLDRERRIVRESDMVPSPPSSLVPQRHASAASSGADELRVRLANHTSAGPELTSGDVDADWQAAETSGDGAPGGDNPTPDQDVVEEIGRALGVQYDDDEELRGGDEIADRDHDRWELDPASSEDFEDR